MLRKINLRATIVFPLVFLITSGVIVVAQRGGTSGGGGGGGTTSPSRAPSSPQTSPPNGGQRAPTGSRSGLPAGRGRGPQEPQKKPQDDLDPNNGMVVAFVTVTAKDHRSVPGLTQKNFLVTEDKDEQKIELFSVENGPLSVGFVLGGPPQESKGVPLAFMKATPWNNNEFFLINDDGHPPGGTVIQSFTTDPLKATALYLQGGVSPDSIYLGLDYLKEAANARKVLLLIGGSLTGDAATPAGGGLDPYYVERQATKQEVQVYSILTSNDDTGAVDDGGTSDIAPLTGGQDYVSAPVSFSLERNAEDIAHGLAIQYRIGYRSTNSATDGKFRRIRVSLVDVPETLGKLKVWTKSGYYADKVKKK
jgi:hypothetical protein